MEFCNEDNFQEVVLDKVFPGMVWERDRVVPDSGIKTRPDFRCEELKLIVEYNGYRHYTASKQILRDYKKKEIYEGMGYKVVDFPYWIQPDKETLGVLFSGLDGDFDQHFSDDHQGFMSEWSSCVLPADFCELGAKRFKKELKSFGEATQERVLWSLKNRIGGKRVAEEVVFTGLLERVKKVDLSGLGSSVL